MHDQFSRTAMLLGEAKLQTLLSSQTAVFGIGGVGGYCAEALARSGIGTLDLFDNDRICLTNLNRQIIALHSTLGRYKVDVMRERILDINPAAVVGAHKLFYAPDSAGQVDLRQYDYIIDAIDTVTAKLELICRANEAGVPIISAMGAANKLNPTAFEVSDIYKTDVCPLARIMRRELKKRGIQSLKVVYSKEPPLTPITNDAEQASPGRRQTPASNAFVPPVAGLILAGEVVMDLIAKNSRSN